MAQVAKRLQQVPPYIFVELDRMKEEAIAQGQDVISLSIGDPDLPTPQIIVQALAEGAAIPQNHRYPLGAGKLELRQEIAHYYARIYGVELDPKDEIIALIGSKEGIGHFPLAFVDDGDVVLYPEPGYPVYRIATLFAGGIPIAMPLRPENKFLPDLEAIGRDVLERTKIMFLNYPNNPTAAFATEEFFERVVALAKRYGFIVVHDAAYLDLAFYGKRAVSFLQIPGAKEVGIEMHSFSKTFNMTGWRLGFACGNAELVQALLAIKSNLDSGVFGAIQHAGIVALRHYDEIVPPLLETYQKRAEVLVRGLEKIGWEDFTRPEGTFYVWLRTRGKRSSFEMTRELLRRCAVMVTPGTAFGDAGEGFIRMAVTAPEERIAEALQRIERANL